MDDVKVCPRCGAEYYAHVSICDRCKLALVAPNQINAAREMIPDDGTELVCIIEGPRDRVLDISGLLKKAGFAAQLLKKPDAKGDCTSADGYGVYVPRTQAHAAARKADDAWRNLHPEMVAAQERMNAGLCPACGTLLITGNPECPDCGLFLGDPSCHKDPSCGSCD